MNKKNKMIIGLLAIAVILFCIIQFGIIPADQEKQGHIVSYWGDQSQGGRRKYYHITDSGNAAYEKALSEWLHAKNIITMLLQGGKDE